MKRFWHLSLIPIALCLVAAGTPRAPTPTVEKVAPAVDPKDLPPDDPADIALLRAKWRGGLMTDANGNVENFDCTADDLVGHPELQHAVSRLRHVRFAGAEGTKGFDLLLAAMASWRNLENASFLGPVSDDDLANLENARGLTRISISSDQLTDAVFTHIGKLKNLNRISIGPHKKRHAPLKINGNGLKELSDLRKLTRLALVNCPIDDVALTNLKGLELKWLELRGAAITDRGIATISDVTTLKELLIVDTMITDDALSYLPKLRHLSRFTVVGGPRIKGSGLRQIMGMKELRFLCLEDCPIDDGAMRYLKGMRLEIIELGNSRITDRGIEEIKEMTSLEMLGVEHCHISDAAMRTIKGLRLKELDVSYTDVSDRGMDELAGMTSLQDLYVEHTKVTNAVFAKLNHIKSNSSEPLRIHGIPRRIAP